MAPNVLEFSKFEVELPSLSFIAGWHAKFLLGSGFSKLSFHLTNGGITSGSVSCNYEYHGKQFRFHMEIH